MVLMGLTAYFRLFEDQYTAQQNTYVFWSVFAGIVVFQMWFLIDVIEQMTSALGIYCLSLERRDSKND